MEQRKSRQKGKKVEKRNKLVQPSTSFADCEDIPAEEDVGKDFTLLANAPTSQGGHFVLKSEKNWTVDVPQLSDYFTLDLKLLNAAIESIPFNEYMEIEDKYFTSDQLTAIHNVAEKGKETYKKMLEERAAASDLQHTTESKTSKETEKECCQNIEVSPNDGITLTQTEKHNKKSDEMIDSIDKDLDFLLSLKEPVKSDPVIITSPVSTPQTSDTKAQPAAVSTKTIDLDKWLDSVLED